MWWKREPASEMEGRGKNAGNLHHKMNSTVY